jgi:thermostable 8-oxoguanine DNA glycosylase
MKIAERYTGDLNEFFSRYRYQPKLTDELDARSRDIDQQLVNEIVLWKVNRYALLSPESLRELNALAKIGTGSHRDADKCLKLLLVEGGVDLPMASTVLRFTNADAFQIIDRHAYRAIYGEDYPLYSGSGLARKSDVYFEYLDKLVDLSNSRKIPFRNLDRILYVFDKELNGKLG